MQRERQPRWARNIVARETRHPWKRSFCAVPHQRGVETPDASPVLLSTYPLTPEASPVMMAAHPWVVPPMAPTSPAQVAPDLVDVGSIEEQREYANELRALIEPGALARRLRWSAGIGCFMGGVVLLALIFTTPASQMIRTKASLAPSPASDPPRLHGIWATSPAAVSAQATTLFPAPTLPAQVPAMLPKKPMQQDKGIQSVLSVGALRINQTSGPSLPLPSLARSLSLPPPYASVQSSLELR